MAKYQGLSGGYNSRGEFVKGLENNRPVIPRIFSFWSSGFRFEGFHPFRLSQLAAVLTSARRTGWDQIPPVVRGICGLHPEPIRNSG